MRTLLTTSSRPRVALLNSRSNRATPSATRRALGASRGRRICFNDAFTLLLAPILGTALIADTALKDWKQQNWNAKIAEVLDDLINIQEKELQIWQNLQVRSIQNGVLQQRRSYTTQATAFRSEDLMAEAVDNLEDEDGRDVKKEILEDAKSHHHIEDGSASKARSKLRHDPLSSFFDGAGIKRSMDSHSFEALIAWRLAVEMHLLEPDGLPETVIGENILSSAAAEHLNDLEKLLLQQSMLKSQMRVFEIRRGAELAEYNIRMDEDQQAFESYISSLVRKYKNGRIRAKVLIHEYSRAVYQTRRPLSMSTYTALLEAVSTRETSDRLSSLVAQAMSSSRQPCSIEALRALIWQYGKYNRTHNLGLHLSRLTRRTGGRQFSNPWEYVRAGLVRIAVPVNRDANLLSALVKAGLKSKMLRSAEIWAIIMCQGQNATSVASVFRSFLTYCSDSENWQLGQEWLQKAIMWLSLCHKAGPDTVARIIFRILEMCVACSQREVYDLVIQAAVQSGISASLDNNTRAMSFTPRGRSIRLDWLRKLRSDASQSKLERRSSAWKVRRFQEILAQAQPCYAPFVGVSNFSRLNALMKEQESAGMSDSTITLSPQKVLLSTGYSIIPYNRRIVGARFNGGNVPLGPKKKKELIIRQRKISKLEAATANQETREPDSIMEDGAESAVDSEHSSNNAVHFQSTPRQQNSSQGQNVDTTMTYLPFNQSKKTTEIHRQNTASDSTLRGPFKSKRQATQPTPRIIVPDRSIVDGAHAHAQSRTDINYNQPHNVSATRTRPRQQSFNSTTLHYRPVEEVIRPTARQERLHL